MKLEIGYNHSFEIRNETYISNCPDNFSILYLSDLHLNSFCSEISKKICATIDELNPTIILFGGDYVDSKKGLFYFNNILNALSYRENMFAIAGNHDFFYGIEKIKKSIIENNVKWIEKKTANLKIGSTQIKIDGNHTNYDPSYYDFSILLLHKPLHINQFADKYNMAFAGHLHGGQFVLWKSSNNLYPGKLFYKWNILKTRHKKCDYFISKGLGDTLPIRYNCKKDMLFIQVLNINQKKI